ncbi:uncharacterized protein LOC112905945 [Agrilus planipennis]|uniref:Uncharacterized protein LOC112905945 n=1 Tax=Agrilus planipennis TaxID=224129 RepID=A0A7F5RGQ6_AGRPL|nr:uncharacterized protein LOC112905945 [Agrilus planipennis]
MVDPYDVFAETYALSEVNYSSSTNLFIQEKTKAYKRRKMTSSSGRKKNYIDVEVKTSLSKSPTLISDNTLKASSPSSLNVIYEDERNVGNPPRRGNKKSPRFGNDSSAG